MTIKSFGTITESADMTNKATHDVMSWMNKYHPKATYHNTTLSMGDLMMTFDMPNDGLLLTPIRLQALHDHLGRNLSAIQATSKYIMISVKK